MVNEDLNALARAIYEGNYVEKPKTVSNKTPKGNESDYHCSRKGGSFLKA